MPTSPKTRLLASKAKAVGGILQTKCSTADHCLLAKGGKRPKRSEEELESDRNALRVEREFSRMGNKFYKDPDLENPQEDHTPTDLRYI